jgi:DNA-directed RNA polymerase subunit RPC12/RpoP
MSLAFVCDRCDRPVVHPVDRATDAAECPACGMRHALRVGADAVAVRRVDRCLRCGLDHLYLQKDFNRKLGLGVFAVAALLSVPTWGLSLLAATLIDLGLYYFLGDVAICYRCLAQHRGFVKNPAHGAFDLHVAERVDRLPRTA